MSSSSSSSPGEDNPNTSSSSSSSGLGVEKVKPPNFTALLYSSKPTNVVAGSLLGVSSTLGGATAAVALTVGTPIFLGVNGYNSSGVGGALLGALIGSIVGAVAGAGVAVACTLQSVWHITLGVVRTPASLAAAVTGRDWDNDTEEFVQYDLRNEADRVMPLSEEDFMTVYRKTSSVAKALDASNQLATIGGGAGGGRAGGGAGGGSGTSVGWGGRRRDTKERALYDLLGVEPHASPQEIKKAYYVKARQSHPDRNPGDTSAHEKFQRIGDAYAVLSDDRLRAAYDSRGQEAVQSAPKMDASAVYAMVFGSEAFEPLIGELSVATHVRQMVEPGGDTSTELLAFKQRKREVQLALTLVSKLAVLVDDNDPALLKEKAEQEAAELAEGTLGRALLAVIGGVYVDRAAAEANVFASSLVFLKSCGQSVLDTVEALGTASQAALSGLSFMAFSQALEKKQQQEDERSGLSQEARNARNEGARNQMGLGPGPGASESERKEYRQRSRAVSSGVVGLMWHVTRMDIVNTLTGVCNKVLHDHSVSAEVREKRRQGVAMLGEAYLARGGDALAGLTELVDKIGVQSGLYGPGDSSGGGDANVDVSGEGQGDDIPPQQGSHTNHHAYSSSSASSSSSSPSSLPLPPEVCRLMLRSIPSLSVRELKERLAQMAATPNLDGRPGRGLSTSSKMASSFLEKADLQAALRKSLLSRMPDNALREVMAEALEERRAQAPRGEGEVPDLRPEECDREMLLDVLEQLLPHAGR